MKTLLIALAVTAVSFSAEAQKSANSKFAKNYSVCQVGGQYQICGEREAMQARTGRVEMDNTGSLAMSNMNVYMGERNTARSQGRGRIMVTYDDPNGPYEGKESLQNDGTFKNEARNKRYGNESMILPANDGGVSSRR